MDENILTTAGSSGSDNGANGENGWSPEFALVETGDVIVLKVVGWSGGTGARPDVGQYVGSDGFVKFPENAVNIRGKRGRMEDVHDLDLYGTVYALLELVGALHSKLPHRNEDEFKKILHTFKVRYREKFLD